MKPGETYKALSWLLDVCGGLGWFFLAVVTGRFAVWVAGVEHRRLDLATVFLFIALVCCWYSSRAFSRVLPDKDADLDEE